MRKHLFRAVLVLAVVLAVSASAFAQGGMIKGKVLDPKGQPVPDAKVSMVADADGRKFETNTDKKGEFIQIGLRSGAYKVTATKDKIGTQTLNATVRQGGGGANLEFSLSPISGLTAADQQKLIALQAAFQAGTEASKSNNHDVAIAKFTEATTISADCVDCYINLGHAHVGKQQYNEAEAAFKKATELQPTSSDAFAGLAMVYNAQKKYDLAQAAGAKASELAPAGGGGGGAEAAFNQGVILWNSGKFAEAKTQFEAAVKANPGMADAHYQLAMANLNLGQIPAAVEAFEGYLKAAPDGPKAAEVKAAVAALKK